MIVKRSKLILIIVSLLVISTFPHLVSGQSETPDAAITVSSHHILITYEGNMLKVGELLGYRNSGSGPIPNGTAIKISVPQGSRDFSSEHACCMTQTEYGYDFRIPETIEPDTDLLLDLSYSIPLTSDRYLFTKKVFYKTLVIVLYVNITILKLEDFKALGNRDDFDYGGHKYAQLTSSDTEGGTEVEVLVSTPGTFWKNWLWIGTAALTGLIGGATLLSITRRGDRTGKLAAEKDALLDVLKQLDEDYAGGRVDEIQYLKLKLKFKERLTKVEKKLSEYSRR